jgi:hypothetical protein
MNKSSSYKTMLHSSMFLSGALAVHHPKGNAQRPCEATNAMGRSDIHRCCPNRMMACTDDALRQPANIPWTGLPCVLAS